MSQIWLTSDTHFCHDKDFIWQNRGFNNVYEMNEQIIKRWNSVVSKEDIVYYLGDVIMGNVDESIKYLKQLNGTIYIAYGNHCTDTKIEKYKECHNVADVQMGYRIKKGKISFLLTHYPTLVANVTVDKPIWNLHGHTHSKDKWSEVFHTYNVNMDAHNCYPVNLEDIIKDIKERKEK